MIAYPAISPLTRDRHHPDPPIVFTGIRTLYLYQSKFPAFIFHYFKTRFVERVEFFYFSRRYISVIPSFIHLIRIYLNSMLKDLAAYSGENDRWIRVMPITQTSEVDHLFR